MGNFKEDIAKVRLIVLDVDGVMQKMAMRSLMHSVVATKSPSLPVVGAEAWKYASTC